VSHARWYRTQEIAWSQSGKFCTVDNNAPVVERYGVIRVEPDGLVEVLNGAVVLALIIVGIAPA
jgi:hypothetical protein